VAARKGRFELAGDTDLWRLLVEVTLHKLYRTAAHHFAQQRCIGRDVLYTEASQLAAATAGTRPSPEEALATADELEAVLAGLADRDRFVLEMRLQGFELQEIAERLGCSERTVRRTIHEVRRRLVARAGNDFVPSEARRRVPFSAPHGNPPIIDERDAPLRWKDFVLHEQIGAGTTGKVYRATRKADGRPFAVKYLRKSLISSAAAIDRFLSEARLVAGLGHEGIVAIHGIGKTPVGGLFFVMDHIQGRDLHRLRQAQAVGVNDALSWVAQAASTLQFAHERGVVHCDIKPSNLLLNDQGKIRVTDFGFAVQLGETIGAAASLEGTPAFMAPEQIDSCWGDLSPRTDVWGLGGVLFFLLFGRPPFGSGDLPTVLGNIVSSRPVGLPPAEIERIPSPVIDILQACLAKQSSKRVATAQALADLLLRAASADGNKTDNQ
jgi:hypothetical protein